MKLTHRPRVPQDGDKIFPIPKTWFETNDERAVTFSFICNRHLFGQCYQSLVPEVYEKMGRRGGVLIAPFVPTSAIIEGASFPGDIDLLIIPYDEETLLLSAALAIEVKVVRAKYSKQGKAPNEFGFSQANAIFSQGIPYAAVAHLIVSDTSPTGQWRVMHAAQVVNAETGEIGELQEVRVDMLPADLIDRSFGRLSANCSHDSLGLVAAYVSFERNGFWMPTSRRATKNTEVSQSTLAGLERFYNENYRYFLDTPKHPPRS